MKWNYEKLLKECTAYNNFLRDYNNNNLSQCYLLIGEDGFLRNKILQAMLKILFCSSSDKPCNKCLECTKIENNNNLDVMYFGTETSFNKDDANRLREECYIRPLTGDLKVLVVPNADKMEELTQNKLLKTLEELPSSVMVILSVSAEVEVLPTIRSRMRKLYVNNIDKELREILKDNPLREEILLCSNGHIEEVERLSKDTKFVNYYDFALSLLNDFHSSRELGGKGKFFVQNKNDIEQILKILMYVIYDNMKNNKTTYPTVALPNCIRAVGKGLVSLSKYANTNAVIDGILLTILEEKSKCK